MEAEVSSVASEAENNQVPGTGTPARVSAHACPEPLPVSVSGPYDAFVERSLGLPPKSDELVVVRISPRYKPDRTLSLVSKRDGTFYLRSTRLTEDVWAKMIGEMGKQQGDVLPFDEQHQRIALSRMSTSNTVRERRIDTRTARLVLGLWRSLAGRAQNVQEAEGNLCKCAVYRVWQAGRGIYIEAPEPGSVLGDAVLSAERLEELTAEDSSNVEAALDAARLDMREALGRTRRREPCVKPYVDWNR
jgi:hypothetical protein